MINPTAIDIMIATTNAHLEPTHENIVIWTMTTLIGLHLTTSLGMGQGGKYINDMKWMLLKMHSKPPLRLNPTARTPW